MRINQAGRLLLGIALAGAAVACWVLLPTRDYVVAVLERIQQFGAAGPFVLVGLYIIACLLLIPGSLLTVGAGFAFGVVQGTAAVSVGSVLGATAAFLAGRTFARPFVEERIARYPRFAALDRAVAQQGFKIVLLARLSPLIPFNLLNYALGLTRVSLRDYVLASWMGMLPATLVYVYLGSAVRNIAELAAGRIEGGTLPRLLFLVGLVATAIVTIMIGRLARNALNDAIQCSPHAPCEGH